MRLFHGRWERATSLLAAGALSGAEREAALDHAAACAECAADLSALRAVLEAAGADEACAAEPPIADSFLYARVVARLDEAKAAPARPRRAWAWAGALAAAGLVAAVVLAPRPHLRSDAPMAADTGSRGSEAPQIAVSDDALDRMERTMARERAVRYLDEAQDVIVTVSGAPQRCRRAGEHVDVADETRRSRQLLARRASLDLDGSAALSAGPVLDDVERVLREVASLDNCARRRDVEAIHRSVERDRLLMKIELMTLELEG